MMKDGLLTRFPKPTFACRYTDLLVPVAMVVVLISVTSPVAMVAIGVMSYHDGFHHGGRGHFSYDPKPKN
jgi:hypothetical protein